eukprot:4838383-Amphidinium_carterae.2
MSQTLGTSQNTYVKQRQESKHCYSIFMEFERCSTLVIECRGGLPQPQLLGRANPTGLAWQAANPKMRGSQSLSVSFMLRALLERKLI